MFFGYIFCVFNNSSVCKNVFLFLILELPSVPITLFFVKTIKLICLINKVVFWGFFFQFQKGKNWNKSMFKKGVFKYNYIPYKVFGGCFKPSLRQRYRKWYNNVFKQPLKSTVRLTFTKAWKNMSPGIIFRTFLAKVFGEHHHWSC